MSLIVLDDQLIPLVFDRLRARWSVAFLRDLRAGQHILDDRIPAILLGLSLPTFLTIDHGFRSRRLCHPGYCILHFELSSGEQDRIPRLFRSLSRRAEFRTRATRMGKVASLRPGSIEYWQFGHQGLRRIPRP